MQHLDEGLITTWPVMTETRYLLGKTLGMQSQINFIGALKSDLVSVFDINVQCLPQVQDLMQKYANLPMDLADASLGLLAEHLGTVGFSPLTSVILTLTDLGRKNHQPFQNLLLPEHSCSHPSNLKRREINEA
jgi:hypothetical protein